MFMKKLFVLLLCLLLTGICACRRTSPETPATTNQEQKTDEEKTIGSTKPSVPRSETTISKNDPYSDAIKAYVERCDKYGILFGEGTPENQLYALYDIDGDGIEELLAGNYIETLGPFLCGVYVIQNGVAVEQENYFLPVPVFATPPPMLFKNGTLRSNGIVKPNNND